MHWMFRYCSGLEVLDVSGFGANQAENLEQMFSACKSLKSLNLGNFDTSRATNMELMFSNCSSLESLDLTGFDTGNVTDMRLMFAECTMLKELDLSSFDLGKLTENPSLYRGCDSLTVLKTPVNVKIEMGVPTTNKGYIWQQEDGTEVKRLPLNTSHSITIRKVKKPTGSGSGTSNPPELGVIGSAGSTKIVKISSIKITGPSSKIAAGKKITLSVGIYPSNASNKELVWKTSNKKVATVSQKGVVTMKAKSGGKKVTVTAAATDGSNVKKSFTITSMKGVVKKIAISGKKTVKAGRTLKLTAKVTATKGANKKLKWTSGNKKYATVSSSGKVSAKKAGKGKKVKITAAATDGSKKKKTVTVSII